MKISSEKVIFLLLSVLFAIFLLAGCSKKPPAENKLADTFTEEFLAQITEQCVNDISEYFSIDEVKLLRRQTNEKTDKSDCIISLSNSSYTCTIETTLHYEYYDYGGWLLNNWDIQNVAVRPLNGASDSNIKFLESMIYQYYPDATLTSRETSLEQDIPSDILTYNIPTMAYDIGTSGMRFEESGEIKIICTFQDVGYGFSWISVLDLSSFYRDWYHFRGTWNNTGPQTSGFGSIYSVTINELESVTELSSATFNFVICHQTGSKTNTSRVVYLTKCVPNTTISDIVQQNHCYNAGSVDFESRCYFYCQYNYPKYASAPDDEPYYGCIAFTEKGLYVFKEGKLLTDTDGSTYTRYYSACEYLP